MACARARTSCRCVSSNASTLEEKLRCSSICQYLYFCAICQYLYFCNSHARKLRTTSKLSTCSSSIFADAVPISAASLAARSCASVSICTFVLVKLLSVLRGTHQRRALLRRFCQYLYFCTSTSTSKASKLSPTCATRSCCCNSSTMRSRAPADAKALN